MSTKRKRRRSVGAYSESPAPAIDLPYTLVNLRSLLADGARSDALYTHQQIKNWADQFWWTQSEQVMFHGGIMSTEIKAAADLAQEIEMQWDMYLTNTYTLPELQHLDFSQLRLPHHWFGLLTG